jgi:hypothetical protein
MMPVPCRHAQRPAPPHTIFRSDERDGSTIPQWSRTQVAWRPLLGWMTLSSFERRRSLSPSVDSDHIGAEHWTALDKVWAGEEPRVHVVRQNMRSCCCVGANGMEGWTARWLRRRQTCSSSAGTVSLWICDRLIERMRRVIDRFPSPSLQFWSRDTGGRRLVVWLNYLQVKNDV